MNKRKYYGKKIRKTKNLYRKKRSPGQRVFGTVVLVLAVSAAAFLGFCIGKPILDYLGGIGTETRTEWTPAASYSEKMENEDPQSEGEVGGISETAATAEPSGTAPVSQQQTETAPQQPAVQSTTPEIKPVSENALISSEAPASALSNSSSLAGVLEKAKTNGYNAVAVQLKDKNGYFKYKTGIEGVTGSSIVSGTMTLDEIISVFREHNMTPIAEIAVLSDHAGCEVFSEMNYKCIGTTTSWLDYTQNPPKRWSNPESTATREYNSKILTEIMTAGFENIILTDVIFPNFQHYDTAYIAQKYYDKERYKMLYNVIKAGTIIEMNASDVLAPEGFGRTAEVLYDVTQLHDNDIGLVISRSALPTDAGYPADAKRLVETVLDSAGKKAAGLNIIPIIDGTGFDDAEKSKIISALGNLGYDTYIMR